MVKNKQLLKRKAIVDAVLKLMEEYEFDNLTVRMICDTAGISVGTFYHYFSEKNALISEILGQIDLYLEEQAVDKLTHDDELENLLEFGRLSISQINSTGYVMAGLISSVPLPYTPEGIEQEFERTFFSIPLEIITRGQEKGQFITDISAKQITEIFVIFLRGFAFDWSRRNGSYSLEEKYELYNKYFLRFIMSSTPA
ncbi:TetR/AcrR family transcriptional regulator [Acetobacterium bakii]|uniref:HTH tetR-type domain-containing protein n=1 Tax=Acetobacterium bakii TaxID=52689 RepID=A0A0L6TVC3_9FIRM|nr:TetR/AcrR family transcriptional regulator [Acetobacterium bakii]KNZ40221.1 hypothetical protein AKG39_18795 [Acetobacterium bakii]